MGEAVVAVILHSRAVPFKSAASIPSSSSFTRRRESAAKRLPLFSSVTS
ncbi:MAG: hypothetical protein R3B51_14420 [Thermodesulfobacteriota bacterium]